MNRFVMNVRLDVCIITEIKQMFVSERKMVLLYHM